MRDHATQVSTFSPIPVLVIHPFPPRKPRRCPLKLCLVTAKPYASAYDDAAAQRSNFLCPMFAKTRIICICGVQSNSLSQLRVTNCNSSMSGGRWQEGGNNLFSLSEQGRSLSLARSSDHSEFRAGRRGGDAQELCVTSSIFQMPKRASEQASRASKHAMRLPGRPPPIGSRADYRGLPRVCDEGLTCLECLP